MSYDAYKQESDRDYEDRMHVHDRGPLPESHGGLCACGNPTLRSVAGIGWQCSPCGELAMRQQFEKRVRRA